MNNKLWNEFLNGEAVINCETKNEAKQFIKLCKNNKFKEWSFNELLDNTLMWDSSVTCYRNDNGKINFGDIVTYKDDMWGIEKIVTYTELMKDKKTFTGPELAQAILDGKFKEGTKFSDEYGTIYSVAPLLNGFDIRHNGSPVNSYTIINSTFTLIEEPKLIFLNQAAKEDKKIKLKIWNDYYFIDKAVDYLRCYDKQIIKQALTKPVWEVEE